jgi:hypothetical protein
VILKQKADQQEKSVQMYSIQILHDIEAFMEIRGAEEAIDCVFMLDFLKE